MSSDAPISTLRFALRAANGVSLTMLDVYRGERDFTDGLILAALAQTNSAAVAGHPELQRRYAVFETPVPEELRRPISINAVAASLGLPFETVRRRIKQLAADGLCEMTPHGVRYPDAALRSAWHRRGLEACYATVQALYGRVKRAGCLPLMELPAYEEPPPAERAPVRIVWRAAADYFLRMMELLLPRFDSLTQAFIVLEVARANTEAVSDALRGADSPEPQAFIPDAMRRPVRISEVAARLGLPHETARRNLNLLIEDGRVTRVSEGFVVPAMVLARPGVIAAWTANFRNMSRMFGELAETGVLALWDAEDARAETAA